MITFLRRRLYFCVLMMLFIGFVSAQDISQPIPNPDQPDYVVPFSGQVATPRAIDAMPIPQHPFMFTGEGSNIHNDGFMSDTYTVAGPTGNNLSVETVDLGGICATMTFDSQGRILTSCLTLSNATFYLLDGDTLGILDSIPLPYRRISLDDLQFPAGSYFYLDHSERAIIPVVGNEIWQLVATDSDELLIEAVYDLSEILPEDDEINSILPDFDGLLWFTTLNGRVGTLVPDNDSTAIITLENEKIANAFAVDETGGVFIVTDTALYRFDIGSDAQPEITWREVYERGSQQKPGQVSQGSGTTPTVMGNDYVVITDNAEPRMNVLVYRRGVDVSGDRLVCSVPVFNDGLSATENSVIATDRSIIVENNYGSGLSQLLGGLSQTGLSRIDILDDESCEPVWTSDVRIPSAVTKLSLATGLIYTYTRDDAGFATGSWYLTAIDYETGEVIWTQYAGTGTNFNNNYAAVYLANNGVAYIGVTGGIVSIRDNP